MNPADKKGRRAWEQGERRDFLKAGLVTAAASALGTGVMKPVGLWAATPKIKGPIKVGYQAVLSGTLAGYGEFHKMGALMAVEEINAAGGIAGNKMEMEFRDSTLPLLHVSRMLAILWIVGGPIFLREWIHRVRPWPWPP